MKKTPSWTEDVLQGLAFWIGYKKQYYAHYDLTEGAIVAETLSLLNAKICEQKLLPEVMYKKLLDNGREIYDRNDRADIVIASTESRKNELYETVKEVIEVKRYRANREDIKKDMNRLAALLEKSKNTNLRCFVLVVSESKYPKRFMSNPNKATGKKIELENGCEAYVRRVCKTTTSFKKNAYKKAHYACLIEVVRS